MQKCEKPLQINYVFYVHKHMLL